MRTCVAVFCSVLQCAAGCKVKGMCVRERESLSDSAGKRHSTPLLQVCSQHTVMEARQKCQ